VPEPLTKEEAKKLIRACNGGYTGFRDKAYLSLLYRCGLRNNECRMLDIEDLRAEGDWSIRVRYPKGVANGAKPRSVGIDQGTREHLETWLAFRGTAPGPLFMTTKGKRLDTSHFRRKVKILSKAAGITRRVHPHALRHTFARTMHDEGVSMRLIQLALGHSRLDTTATYLQSLGDPEVIATTAGREW